MSQANPNLGVDGMNLILFEPAEIDRPLPRDDRRARHILEVLRRQPGETFDVGLLNGPRGKATLVETRPNALLLAFSWAEAPAALDAITLIVGLPRPQTARDILRDATTLGVRRIDFVLTERSDPSYAQSTLWSSGEWRRHLVAGAEQAFDTRIPDITPGVTLADAIRALPPATIRLALDNYESATPLSEHVVARHDHVVLAIGAERGWSARERDDLRAAHFTLVHLGPRVLRTETAVTAALAIMRGKLGLM